MTKTDKKKLATFDRHNARLTKFEAMKGCTEAQLMASTRIMERMALIRDGASLALRQAIKERGWT